MLALTILIGVITAGPFDVVGTRVAGRFVLVGEGEDLLTYAEAYGRACRDGRTVWVVVGQGRERIEAMRRAARTANCHFAIATAADGFTSGVHELVPIDGVLYYRPPPRSVEPVPLPAAGTVGAVISGDNCLR